MLPDRWLSYRGAQHVCNQRQGLDGVTFVANADVSSAVAEVIVGPGALGLPTHPVVALQRYGW